MIEDDQFILNNDEPENPSETDKQNKFPVRTQLVIIAAVLFFIFASVIVPKTFALFNTEADILPTPNDTILTIENDEIFLPQKIESLSLKAGSAYVWDIVGQRALYSKEPDKRVPLASITKLMTALVAYEVVADDTLVTMSKSAASEESGGGLKSGEVFEIKDLADFALVSSYNSAAHTLAESVGKKLGNGDAMGQFVAAMNIKADEINLPSLEFFNSTGLDVNTAKAGSYGSARDISFLMEYIYLTYPEILIPTVSPSTRLYNQSGEFHEANNTNDVLLDIPNLLGTKTGYTDLAGGNLTIIFDAGFGRPVVVTVLGSTRNERFSDVKKIVRAVQDSISPKI